MFIIGGIIAIFYIFIRIMLGLEDNDRKKDKSPMVGLSIFAIIMGIIYAFSGKK